MKIDMNFARDVVRRALRCGADQAEFYAKISRKLSVEIRDQSVESLTASISGGYSLRVIRKSRLGFSYSTDPRDRNVVIRNAVDAAEYADRDSFLDLPVSSAAYEVEIDDPDLRSVREDDAIDRTMLLERSAYEEDARIRKVRSASGNFASSETIIVNSRDIEVNYAATSCSAQIMAVAEDGNESEMGWDYEGSRFLSDISFQKVGSRAAASAVRMLGARKIEGIKADVILDSAVTIDFLGIFAASLSSDAVLKGKSLLKDRLNEKVISSKISILDSGRLPRRLGSKPVDDEGVPVGKVIAIEAGVLKSYFFNTYTARKTGSVSTGNGVRNGFSSLPAVGINNLYLDSSSDSYLVAKKNLLNSLDKGLYVVDAMGVHTANPISGEFSIGVAGLWIEKGEVLFPVKEAVISGNILEFFGRVESIGDDMRFFGSVGAPSIRISSVDISA